MVRMDSDLCARYRVLQQEADFALWRAREANVALRERYAKAQRNDGTPPGDPELGDLKRLESDAEEKYRQLRDFLRSEFDERVVPR
jgi:hypothetical protein